MDRSGNRRPAGTSSRLDQLFPKLIGSEDEGNATQIISQIIVIDGALPFILDRRGHGSADERWWSIRLLAEFDEIEARVAVRKALSDPDASVRQCAALVIRDHPDPDSLPGLAKLLLEGDRLLARLAGDALIQLGNQSTSVLLDTLEHGPQPARVEAARALALTDDMKAVSALFKCLDDESAVIEYWADEGLKRRGIGMVFYQQ